MVDVIAVVIVPRLLGDTHVRQSTGVTYLVAVDEATLVKQQHLYTLFEILVHTIVIAVEQRLEHRVMGFWGWVFTIFVVLCVATWLNNFIDWRTEKTRESRTKAWRKQHPDRELDEMPSDWEHRSFLRLFLYWLCFAIPILLFAWWADSN